MITQPNKAVLGPIHDAFTEYTTISYLTELQDMQKKAPWLCSALMYISQSHDLMICD